MNIFQYTKILRSNSFQPEEMRFALVLYWRILLGSVLVFVITIFAYGGWQLFEVMKNVDIISEGVSVGSRNAPVKNEDVKALLEAILSRQEQFDTYKAGAPEAVADPAR